MTKQPLRIGRAAVLIGISLRPAVRLSLADKKSIFVIRADGSIVGGGSSDGLFAGSPLSAALRPGDMVVVPEKAAGQSQKWKTLMATAATVSSVATSAILAAKF